MEKFELEQSIRNERQAIASSALLLQLQKMPEIKKNYSPYQMEKTMEDFVYHLQFLESAMYAESPALFANYLIWLKELLENLGVPIQYLRMSVVCLSEVLKSKYTEDYDERIENIISEGLKKLDLVSIPSETFLTEKFTYTPLAMEYLKLLLNGDRHKASELILNAVIKGAPIKEIYLQVFQNTQYEIGRLWQTGKINVAQEHYCTAATQFVMAQLYPYIFKIPNRGATIVATCVGQELHEIGIRMVVDFMELSGFNTYYLGARTPADSIIKSLIDQNAQILAVSTTMTFHIAEVVELIQKVRASKGCENVKIMVGGYPFNIDRNLWQVVGADCYSSDSEDAVIRALELTNGS